MGDVLRAPNRLGDGAQEFGQRNLEDVVAPNAESLAHLAGV